MKKHGLMLGLTSLAAVLADPSVVVTSFNWAGPRPLAEICGKVIGAESDYSIVKVTADPRSGRPGVYNLWVDKGGTFCSLIACWEGQASVSVKAFGKTVVSEVAMASDGNPRE